MATPDTADMPVIQLASQWINHASEFCGAGRKPLSREIDQMSDLVDALHEQDQHQIAHALDDAMCTWSELINQRGV